MNIRIESTTVLIGLACIQLSTAAAASLEGSSQKLAKTPDADKPLPARASSSVTASNSPFTGDEAAKVAATNAAALRFAALKPLGDWSVEPADTSRLRDIFAQA